MRHLRYLFLLYPVVVGLFCSQGLDRIGKGGCYRTIKNGHCGDGSRY